MAASIKYFDTAKIAYARATTGVTATDGSAATTTFTWYNTAPATDYMWVKAIISATNNAGTADLADCLFHFFVDDGTTARLIRTIDAGNQAIGSATTSAGQRCSAQRLTMASMLEPRPEMRMTMRWFMAAKV